MADERGSSRTSVRTATSTRTTVSRSIKTRINTSGSRSSNDGAFLRLPQTVRCLLLEVPLSLLLLAALFCSVCRHIQHHYGRPYVESWRWTPERAEYEETYYRFECNASDITTDNPDDLSLDFDASGSSRYRTHLLANQAVEKAMKHGAVVLPDLVSRHKADAMRRYVLQKNRGLHRSSNFIEVIMPENRWSFAIHSQEHPSVTNVLEELGNNELLVSTLEALLGRHSVAIVEMQVITAAKGAEHQYWHSDTIPDGSSMRYAHSFTPFYSLLIPLQDTTPEMGATAVCPGTHRCHFMNGTCEGFSKTDKDSGFQVTNTSTNVWKAGHGLLYNSQTKHRGSKHISGDQRTVLILGFCAGPDDKSSLGNWRASLPPNEVRFGNVGRMTRMPPLDTQYALAWDHWGMTLDDLKTIGQETWITRLMRTFGWIETSGWNLVSMDAFRSANDQAGFSALDLKSDIATGKGTFGALARLLLVSEKDPVLLGKNTAGKATPWEKILDTMFLRMSVVMIVTYLVGAGAYIYLVSTYTSQTRATLARLGLLLALSVLSGFIFGKAFIQKLSSWSPVPMILPSTSKVCTLDEPKFVNSLPTPEYQDILIQSLPQFGAKSYDSHPSNEYWARQAKDAAQLYFSLPQIFHDVILDGVISATSAATGGRFLIQNLFGYWVLAEKQEIRSQTEQMILRQALGLGTESVTGPCWNMMSTSVICRPHHLEEKLISSVKKRSESARMDKPLPLPRSFRAIYPRKKLEPLKVPEYFVVGESVQARPMYGWSRKWLNAKVSSIRTALFVDIQYLDMELTTEEGVYIGNVRKKR